MRIISQDGTIDVPYEQCVIQRFREKIYFLNENLVGLEHFERDMEMASYSTEEKAQKAMEMLKLASAKVLVLNANVTDDLDEQLEKLRTVIARDTSESRVELNKLNGYFQFPKDKDVEV